MRPLVFIFSAIFTVGFLAMTPKSGAEPLRGAGYFTNLPLITQDGTTVNFYDDLVKDKIVVFNFIYTDCNDLCSFTTARMVQVADWLGDRVGRDIFIYSISLDPKNDTPEKLRTFAAGFGIEPGAGWTFLTGDPTNIDIIRFKLGERSDTLYDHRSDMLIGNARIDLWRRTSVMGSLKIATQNILELDPDWRAPLTPDALTETGDRPISDYVVPDRRGEAFFLKVCSACHTIGEGVRFGPDLAGVTLRRDHDWLVRYLQMPDIMLKQGDPTAVALNAAFPNVKMPFMGITQTDAEDLIHYLGVQLDGLDSSLVMDDSPGGEAEHDHASHSHTETPEAHHYPVDQDHADLSPAASQSPKPAAADHSTGVEN